MKYNDTSMSYKITNIHWNDPPKYTNSNLINNNCNCTHKIWKEQKQNGFIPKHVY